jgi:hypothetical protein
MDSTLNVACFVFHTLWIAFNLCGWLWRSTRPWHLATLSLTALSWFGLGAWYGWGYCPFTDWHWSVRERLGLDNPPSYIQLLLREMLGLDLTPQVADVLALGMFGLVAALGVTFSLRDRRTARS